VLAVIHDLADRGLRHGRNLDQVQTELGGFGEGGLDLKDSELFAFGTDDTDFACADAAVGACVADGGLLGKSWDRPGARSESVPERVLK
jgi:hypothetical protein